jgi:hypothetical protein
VNLDPERFKEGIGKKIPLTSAHPTLLRGADSSRMFSVLFGSPQNVLTAVGMELWVMCWVARESDPIHQIARQALTAGDPIAYLALLDKIEEDDIATADDNEPARLCASLWQAGLVGEEIDRAVAEISRVKGRVKRALLHGFTVGPDKTVKVRRAPRVKV